MNRLKAKKSVMENTATLQKVRDVYLKFVAKGELVRIDGNRAKAEVAKALADVALKFLKK
jgi:thymidylate kinase